MLCGQFFLGVHVRASKCNLVLVLGEITQNGGREKREIQPYYSN